MAGLRIGIDLGGSKIEGWALGAAPEPLARRRVATPRGDYKSTIQAIVAMVAALEAEAGRRGTVGVGIPGAISPATGLVKNANSTWLIGKPFDKDLAAALGRPVRVENDANCLALSEAADGAGARVVFGVVLGTGVGGGLSMISGLCETVTAQWAEHIFSDTVTTRLAVATHGDASGVRGAAWLWTEDEAE
jgi:fructokinase